MNNQKNSIQASDNSTRLHIDFIGKRHIYYIFSLTLILVGILVCVFTGGVKLNIEFTGGASIKYSYTGNVDKATIQSIAEKALNAKSSEVTVSLDTVKATNTNLIVIQIEKRSISSTAQADLFTQISTKYSSNSLTKYENNDVDPALGADFFMKSIFEVLLASLLIVIYIWFRFRKIGGLPAGITAFIALVHDIIMVFVAFSIFQIPLDENFIAVSLLVLGYSINDTIVVFDRVRENRTIYGTKLHFKDIVNKSINQSFVRSINTTLVTFVSITVVFIFAEIYHIDSIRSFALPMMVGVVTGCYSTICIAGPLWVDWVQHKEKKNPPKVAASKKLSPKKA
jgi:preprotein translocase subunit SecF